MDEGRKRVIGIMAAIIASLHMRTADDLFGGPEGSPRTDKLIAASVQWARLIIEKVGRGVRKRVSEWDSKLIPTNGVASDIRRDQSTNKGQWVHVAG